MRQRRILKKGACYHVTGTINRDEDIFKSDEIKNIFLLVIKQAKMKYKFSLRNFCIINNHIQFVIEPLKDESLSKIMQWILSVFAIRFNRKRKIRGHVWYDRFKSRIIENIQQMNSLFKYINELPVKENIVERSEEYKYCGLYFFLHGFFDIVDWKLKFIFLKN
jgi:putative transposase